jgi:rare lipoprotein A
MRMSGVLLVTWLSLLTAPLFAGEVVEVREGIAAYYSNKLHGRRTASGEIYNKNAMTAAHRTLKFGTRVRVTYLKTGRSVEVVINDRGPTSKRRIIDLSRAAAERLGMIRAGIGRVKLEIYGS